MATLAVPVAVPIQARVGMDHILIAVILNRLVADVAVHRVLSLNTSSS